MNAPWTRYDDQAFRDLVEAHVPAEEIAAKLHRDANNLRQRGYVLGLPRKWFKAHQARILRQDPCRRM
jgi:hypothetical protein